MPARAFASCTECAHAGVQRATCGLCGGATVAQEPPADLFNGWRCACYHCVSTPC
ncbi:MAG TPA: hypothetical protein VM582_01345 [Candidatus Thermoplasmatota archaeon]|nr:hypothetical protein [Candidatus Thermoplasmatota archaeon]